MAEINWTDRRIVIFLAFIIFTAFSFYAFEVPLATSTWVQDFYDFVEQYPAGTKALLVMTNGPDMIGDSHPNIVVMLRYMIEKDWKVAAWSASAASNIIAVQVLTTVYGSNFKESSLYGTQFAWLGLLPGGQPMITTQCESGLRAYRSIDAYGTPLDDLPVMDGFDKASDWDVVVGFGCGAGYSVMPISKIQFGVPFVLVDIQGGASMFASDYLAGNIQGIMPGIKGAAEFEALTGLSGGAASYISATVAISAYAILGITLSNIYYLLLRPKAKRGVTPDRLGGVG